MTSSEQGNGNGSANGSANGNALAKKLLKISLICVNREMHISYLQQKKMILNAIKVNPNFNKLGQIWQTLESGVNYPVLHYLPLSDGHECKSTTDGHHHHQQQHHFKHFELLYEEIERIQLPVIVGNSVSAVAVNGKLTDSAVPTTASSAATKPANEPKCAHIFLGIKTLDKTFNIVLEENWKDWTGARYLYLNLSSDFGLSKICLFRRVLPNDSNSFMYILIADCTHINDKNRLLLLDFVDRFRLQRLCGYLTVYSCVSNDSQTMSSATDSNHKTTYN